MRGRWYPCEGCQRACADGVFSAVPAGHRGCGRRGRAGRGWARTPQDAAVCPVCGASSGRVHGYHWRTVVGVPVDGRRVVVRVWVRRLVCPTRGCRHTFREQGPESWSDTNAAQPVWPAKSRPWSRSWRAGRNTRAGDARGDRSRHTALRALLRIPLLTGRVLRVIGVDDFALRQRHRYATVAIDARPMSGSTCCPTARPDTLEPWLREHPGIEIVCRDGSATDAEAIRRALPDAVQVADRRHVWHNLRKAGPSEVKAHSAWWATVLDAPIYDGPRAQTTLERRRQVHAPARPGRRLAPMRLPSPASPEHRQTLRPRRSARAHTPRPQVPPPATSTRLAGQGADESIRAVTLAARQLRCGGLLFDGRALWRAPPASTVSVGGIRSSAAGSSPAWKHQAAVRRFALRPE
ncbi:transposase [Streptomyces sp. NPDC002285]